MLNQNWPEPMVTTESGEEKFDCAGILERIRDGKATEADTMWFHAAMLTRFADRVWADEAVEPFILHWLAIAFSHMLAGGDWCDEIQLPWIPQTELYSPAERRGYVIFDWILRFKRMYPKARITEILEEAGEQFGCSYETARGHYYDWKRRLSKNETPDSE